MVWAQNLYSNNNEENNIKNIKNQKKFTFGGFWFFKKAKKKLKHFSTPAYK